MLIGGPVFATLGEYVLFARACGGGVVGWRLCVGGRSCVFFRSNVFRRSGASSFWLRRRGRPLGRAIPGWWCFCADTAAVTIADGVAVATGANPATAITTGAGTPAAAAATGAATGTAIIHQAHRRCVSRWLDGGDGAVVSRRCRGHCCDSAPRERANKTKKRKEDPEYVCVLYEQPSFRTLCQARCGEGEIRRQPRELLH
jgi:hypothetical protein